MTELEVILLVLVRRRFLQRWCIVLAVQFLNRVEIRWSFAFDISLRYPWTFRNFLCLFIDLLWTTANVLGASIWWVCVIFIVIICVVDVCVWFFSEWFFDFKVRGCFAWHVLIVLAWNLFGQAFCFFDLFAASARGFSLNLAWAQKSIIKCG